MLHVMAASPGIHHRALGVVAHAGSAEQMPAAVDDRANDVDMTRACGGEDLLAAIDREVEHAVGVLADRVIDLGRRDAVAILRGPDRE